MFRPSIHLCLVYNTGTSNLTPVLDPAFAPQEVILLHGPQQQQRAAALASVLQPVGVKTSFCAVASIEDLEQLRDSVLSLLIDRAEEDIALNVSGGNRAMSIAAYEIFMELERPVFFVTTTTDRVTWVHDRKLAAFDLANRIKLPAFLQANGAELNESGSRAGVPPALREFGAALVHQAKDLAPALATLNWLAARAIDDLRSPRLSERQRHWPELQQLLAGFAQQGILQIRDQRLYFSDEESRFFANGGWLEVYVYSVIYGLRRELPQIQDIGRSVELSRDGSGRAVKNELDVAFLADNRLFIIECKSKRFITEHSENSDDYDTPGADTVYKLDTLKNLFGPVGTQVMLVSYRELSRWDRQRASDLGIALCTAQQLPRLAERIKRWVVDK